MNHTRNFILRVALVLLAVLHVACGGDDDDHSALVSTGARSVVSLNGLWAVGEGDMGDQAPEQFDRTVPVPALLSAATPRFAEIGLDSDLRSAFWYRRSFVAPETVENAQLVIRKAKYGIKVWLNGTLLGEHLGSYTAAYFDVSGVVQPGASNDLEVRVGAWRDRVPAFVPAAQDLEKKYWLPGIYDDVEIVYTGAPRIVRTKTEPDIENGQVLVKTTIVNDLSTATGIRLSQQVLEAATQNASSPVDDFTVVLLPGEETTIVRTLSVPNARLWSPEDPYLYVLRSVLESDTRRTDELDTRFGMRKVEWRGGTDYDGLFYLNDAPYYLRGSNIALHRFFDDSVEDGNTLAWDRDWVRALLSETPKQLHWNTFRAVIGRLPQFWYDIADEVGVLIVDEFMMWSAFARDHESWSVDQMEIEFREWIQESWNHPSIAMWDASNETTSSKSTEVIARVRDLDPTRQWENGGYNLPQSPNDPIEDHPYFFIAFPNVPNTPEFLDSHDGKPPYSTVVADAPSHPYYINEYGWLWVNRDGTPTELSRHAWSALLGPGTHSPETYRESYAYLVAGLTEFWRARRNYAGVLHFVYLSYSRPEGQTSDNFVDVPNLVLEPRWFEYARHAFAPVGVYIDSWKEDYALGVEYEISVDVINDEDEAKRGTLSLLSLDLAGRVLSESEAQEIEVPPYGKISQAFTHSFTSSDHVLLVAKFDFDAPYSPVVSRRKVGYASYGIVGPQVVP